MNVCFEYRNWPTWLRLSYFSEGSSNGIFVPHLSRQFREYLSCVVYRVACISSLVDLPLHERGVVATEGEQIVVPRGEAHLRHVTAMSKQRCEGRALQAGWVAVQLDLAVIVRCSDDFFARGQGTVRPIRVVDVRAVLAWLPDALHGPTEHVALGVPKLITEVGSTTCVLSSIRDRVVQDLVRAIVGTNGTRIPTPIDMSDKGRTAAEFLDHLEICRSVEVDLVVVRSYCQVGSIGGELQVLNPLLGDLLHVDSLPRSCREDAQSTVTHADGAEFAIGTDVAGAALRALRVLLGSRIFSNNVALGVL